MIVSTRRLLLVYFLLVAIPLQGMASGLMVAGELSYRSFSAMSSHGHESYIESHADSVITAQVSTNIPVLAGAIDISADDHSFFNSAPHKNHLKYNCSGACTSAAAVTNTVLFLATSTDHKSEFTYNSASHLPPALASLERPPRPTL